MIKRIIYIIINLTIAVLLYFIFQLDAEEDPTLKFLVTFSFIAFLLIVVLLIVAQLILTVTYGSNSNKNYDFLLIFTSVYSLLLIILYVMSVKAFIQVRKHLLEMSNDEMINDNPFLGMHTILLIPLALQAVIFILRIRRNKKRTSSNTF